MIARNRSPGWNWKFGGEREREKGKIPRPRNGGICFFFIASIGSDPRFRKHHEEVNFVTLFPPTIFSRFKVGSEVFRVLINYETRLSNGRLGNVGGYERHRNVSTSRNKCPRNLARKRVKIEASIPITFPRATFVLRHAEFLALFFISSGR